MHTESELGEEISSWQGWGEGSEIWWLFIQYWLRSAFVKLD